MSEAYWRYTESRQAPQPSIPPVAGKRPRSDFDAHSGQDLLGYYPREDDRGAPHGISDTDSINASYDRYLRSAQISTFGGAQSARPSSGGIPGHSTNPHILAVGNRDPVVNFKDSAIGLGGPRAAIPLPSDASSTLFVEGLPHNCTQREVAHIFRPFVGYKEVRLVTRESKRPGGDPLVLGFVDFLSPAHAATAMDALQGYKFDEQDRESVNLRLQFARYPGVRSGGGHRGKR